MTLSSRNPLCRTWKWINHAVMPPCSMKRLARHTKQWVAGLGRESAEWEGGAEEIERIGVGRQSLVFRWRHERHGALIVRAWPYSVPARRARDHVEGGLMLKRAGLAVPPVLLWDDGLEARRRWRGEFVVEREAPGTIPDPARPVDPALLAGLAREVARIHAVEGNRWGKPWRAGTARDPQGFWMRRLDVIDNRIRRYGLGDFGTAEAAALAGDLRRALRTADFGRPRLVHGDMNPGNFLVDGEGAITWLDFQTVHFGHPAEDLAGLRRWLAPHGQFEAILAARGGETGDGATAVLEALLAVEKLSMRSRRLDKGSERASEERLDGERAFYQALVEQLMPAVRRG